MAGESQKDDVISASRVGLHTYKGVVMPLIVRPEIIEGLQTFEFRPDDIVVITSPKAGTHWAIEIVGLILADGIPENVKRDTLKGHMEFAQANKDAFNEDVAYRMFYKELEKAPSPRVMFTHLPLKLLPPELFKSKAKIIYVARNPKDTAASLFRFIGQTPEAEFVTWEMMAFGMFSQENLFGPWDEHVIPFWNMRHEENRLFLKYEDMKKEPRLSVSKIAEFIGHRVSEDILDVIVEKTSLKGLKTEMKRLEDASEDGYIFGKAFGKYSYFQKGIIGDWKNHFTVAQNEAFDEVYRRKMANTDLTFDFE